MTFEIWESALLAHLVLEFYPTRERAGRRVILFHMFYEKKQIVPIFSFGLSPFFFFSPMTYVNTICTQLLTAGRKKQGYCITAVPVYNENHVFRFFLVFPEKEIRDACST
jgi:hypothetical protein